MCSRSSSEGRPRLIPVGRVRSHRGADGRLTVTVAAGDADPWTAVRRVWIEGADAGAGSVYEVERSEAYRDRWVLKLRGVDDAGAARGLRSARVAVREEDAPALPEDTHYRARLVGMQVFEESGERLGSVTDVVPTGGADLLRVLPPGASEDEEDRELLIPMARAIVVAVSEADDRITVRLPDGLRELNRSE